MLQIHLERTSAVTTRLLDDNRRKNALRLELKAALATDRCTTSDARVHQRLGVDRAAISAVLDGETFTHASIDASEDVGAGLRAATEKLKPVFAWKC